MPFPFWTIALDVSGQRYAPAALFPLEGACGTHWIGGWVGLRTCLEPGRLATGLSLYRLSRPDLGYEFEKKKANAHLHFQLVIISPITSLIVNHTFSNNLYIHTRMLCPSLCRRKIYLLRLIPDHIT
jgi:hypothetical protein